MFRLFCGCGWCVTVFLVQLLHNVWNFNLVSPLGLSTRQNAASLHSLFCKAVCFGVSVSAIQFSHVQLHGFQQGQLFAEGERCNRVLLQYSRAQLFKMTPARLTLDLISHLRTMQIGVDLSRKRSRRGGRRKQKH